MAGVVVLIISLSAVIHVSLSLECPTPFAQPAARASLPAIDLYLDEEDFQGGKFS